MTEKHLLITGRPASGKTELLVAFANMHPKTTLFFSEECTEEMLKNQKGLHANVAVAVNYTNARNNLKSLIDDACDNAEEIIITTKNDKSVVLISLDEYNRTHTALKREVQESIKEIERGDIIGIEEAFDKVLATS